MSKPEMTIDSRKFEAWIKSQIELVAVEAQIVTSGKPEDYWAVLEHGSAEGSKPWPRSGPRTRRSGGRIFSRQAVGGFVSKNGKIFIKFLTNAAKRVLSRADGSLKQGDLDDAVNDAADQSLEFLQKVVPADSGEFRDSLKVKKAE